MVMYITSKVPDPRTTSLEKLLESVFISTVDFLGDSGSCAGCILISSFQCQQQVKEQQSCPWYFQQLAVRLLVRTKLTNVFSKIRPQFSISDTVLF